MILEVLINNEVVSYDLDKLGSEYSGVINIGKLSKEVWNTIAIDDESVDNFQCNIFGSVGGPWKISHGQERTECPKGLMSNKLIPCNGCMGRCVNIRAGRPKYNQRNPETPTLLNGQPVAEYGSQINTGDEITLGNIKIKVS